MESTPLGSDATTRPARLAIAASPIDPRDPFLFHKTTNREVYLHARRPDCDDVVLWNPDRQVTESTIANIVVDIDGRKVTPPVDCGLLAGTFRAELLESGRDSGIDRDARRAAGGVRAVADQFGPQVVAS